MTGFGPRVLQVLEFAAARAPELQALDELSQHPHVSCPTDVKLETQKNQRRRRANAFNSYKMPRRLRANHHPDVKTALRCRKHRRRPQKLLQDRAHHVANAVRSTWLASHLWHAKRMQMIDQDGYILPSHRADKSVSAALTAVRQNVLLHDVSYYGLLELTGSFEALCRLFDHVLDPKDTDFDHNDRVLAGQVEGESVLYHFDAFPFGTIAPVTFLWKPVDQKDEKRRHLWLWIHPAAFIEAMEAIQTACDQIEGDKIEMMDQRGQLGRFKLRGRRANDVLKMILADTIEKTDQFVAGNKDSKLRDGISTIEKQNEATRRHLLHLLATKQGKTQEKDDQNRIFPTIVPDPRLQRWKTSLFDSVETELSLLKEPAAHLVPRVGMEEIASPFSGLSLSSRGKDAEEPESTAILNELETLMTWTTSNSVARPCFPSQVATFEEKPAENVAISNEMDAFMPFSSLWSSSKRLEMKQTYRPDHELNQRIFKKRQEGATRSELGALNVEASSSVHLLVIKKPHALYPVTSGWDLICSPCTIVGLLQTFVFAGAFVVGLEEDAALATVLKTPSFPRDYPDTRAGQSYWQRRHERLETAYRKKPKAKRVNYAKLGVSSPFQPDWKLLFDAQDDEQARAKLCVLRGATYMEPFCFYRSNDSKKDATIPSFVPVAMPTLVCVHVLVPRRGTIDVNAMLLAPEPGDRQAFYDNKRWQGEELPLGKEMDKRRLIGYVTSAMYDRPKGAVRALGFIACEALEHLFLAHCPPLQGPKHGHYALAMLRSPSSRMVRPVLVQAEP